MSLTSLILLAVGVVDVAVMVLVTVLAAMAFLHCLSAKPIQFQRAFKRTRTFWMLVTGACLLFSLLMTVPAVIALLTGGMPISARTAFCQPATWLRKYPASSRQPTAISRLTRSRCQPGRSGSSR